MKQSPQRQPPEKISSLYNPYIKTGTTKAVPLSIIA